VERYQAVAETEREMDARYKIVEAAAGEGGFGRVDKAIDNELEREVAIKTLDPLFSAEPSAKDIERFRREAKALARLSHPNIPAIYDVQFSEGSSEFRIVFEWIEGQTLREHLQSSGVLSLEDARQLFSRICSALAHAHSHNIIHRDIKPSNIILTPDLLSSYLVDFGISLRKDDLSSLTGGSPVGTPGYMSPEQERGEELTSATDIFSLGIVLYECLAGARPSVGGYRPLSIVNESIPPSVDALIQEALREEPERRPAAANAFSERLAKSLRPHGDFTTTLAEGSLHEIQLALNAMDPVSFSALPAGQRVLLVTRLTDLTSVDEERLRPAVASLLAELVRLAHETKPDSYTIIIKNTFEYGYEKQYGEAWWGNGPARQALNSVALHSGRVAQSLIADEVLGRVGGAGFSEKQGWYFHDLRILLQNLLTNPACPDDKAEPLGKALSMVNEISHQTDSGPKQVAAYAPSGEAESSMPR
jgi:serine/threonine protein kinase